MYGFEEKKQSRIVNTVVIQLFEKMVKMEGTFVGVLHIPRPPLCSPCVGGSDRRFDLFFDEYCQDYFLLASVYEDFFVLASYKNDCQLN